MKKIEIIKLLSLPAALLALSFVGFLAVKSHYNENSREPSSLEEINSKPSDDKISREIHSQSIKLKKPGASVEIEITNADALAKDQPAELTATLKVSRAISSLDVFWHLPAGIELLGGAQTGSLQNLQAGETRSFKITVVSHSNLNQQIHLEASYLQDAQRIGVTTQYNTVNQKVINEMAARQERLVSLRSKEKRIWQ